MGYYINDINGIALPADAGSKVITLLANGATETDGSKFEENLVCVVDNGYFGAAGYAYSQNEYEVFKRPDGRPKMWLIVPNAAELSGYK